MTSTTFFIIFIPILSILLLIINLLLAPHFPYQEKDSAFECGFHSFLGQNRTQFSISFFIFGLLFLLFDLEIVLIYPYSVSSYSNDAYGLTIMMIFFILLTLGFIFELGKNALTIDSKQTSLPDKENAYTLDAFLEKKPNFNIYSYKYPFLTMQYKNSIEYIPRALYINLYTSMGVDSETNNNVPQLISDYLRILEDLFINLYTSMGIDTKPTNDVPVTILAISSLLLWMGLSLYKLRKEGVTLQIQAKYYLKEIEGVMRRHFVHLDPNDPLGIKLRIYHLLNKEVEFIWIIMDDISWLAVQGTDEVLRIADTFNVGWMDMMAFYARDLYEPFDPLVTLIAPNRKYREILERLFNFQVVSGFYQYQKPILYNPRPANEVEEGLEREGVSVCLCRWSLERPVLLHPNYK